MRVKLKRFGEAIREYRRVSGESLRDVARRQRLSHATISRAELGKPVNVETFLVLAKMLDIDPRLYLR